MNRQFITDCENQELNQFRTDYHANYRPAKTTVNFERLYITLFENNKNQRSLEYIESHKLNEFPGSHCPARNQAEVF